VLLSGDTDYDFLILSSADQLARQMKDIGAYEPLNSVQEIDSLLGRCFDYIGEAATADNGDIWMLPLKIECPIMIYNPELCKKYGIDMDKIDTCEKLINSVDTLPVDGSVFYNLLYYYFAVNIFDQYLQYFAIDGDKSNFDTDIFRKYAEIMKEYDAKVMNHSKLFNVSTITLPKDTGINQEEDKDDIYSKTALIIDRGIDYYEIKDYYEYDFFKAAAVPGLTEGQEQKSLADCVLIVLNPNSKKLKWVKEYLGKVCASKLKDTNCDMFKDMDFGDNKLRAELQDVYSRAEIFYQYPYDITDELEAYRMENKPLEDTIKEMERKMDMYLNE
jgi:ABC-type glycerol-3-phosphate transport system substrate-binding protein